MQYKMALLEIILQMRYFFNKNLDDSRFCVYNMMYDRTRSQSFISGGSL